MRVSVLLYIFLLFSFPALAYVEENNVGLAETSAGDQDTNMYKLMAKNDYKIREFKNRKKFGGAGAFEKEETDENKKLLDVVVKTTADSQALKNNIKSDVFFSLLSINEVKDAQIAATLQKQLNGMKR